MTQDIPQPSSQHKENVFVPEGQRTRNKRQGIENQEKGKKEKAGKDVGAEGQRTVC